MDKHNVDFWQTEICIMGNDEEIAFDKTGALIPDGDTDQQGLMCTAYKNTDGTYVMVVVNYAN